MVKENQIDVEPEHLKLIKKILKRHITYKTVWAYGSRVNWTANQHSDLDLVVFEVNSVKLGELKEDFAESDLPFSVDVMSWEKIPENFKNKIRKNYVVLQKKPELEGWKDWKLGDVINVIGGGTPKTMLPEYWNGNIPWLSVVDFNTGRKFVFDTEKKITPKGLNNSSTKLLNKGDIIISARGTVGVMAVLGKEMAFNQSCYGIRAIDGLSINDYIYYLLKDTVLNFLQIAHGGVFDTITRQTFDAIDILLPPLPEQRAIASVLSSLDDKIDLLHRQNKTLEAMAETLFRQWFVPARAGEPHAGGEEAKEDWKKTTLDKHTEVFRGLSYKGSGLTENGFGLPMHNLNSVYEGGGYKYEGIKFYSGEYKQRHQIKPGDIIVTNTEQGHEFKLIGFPAIVPSSFGNIGLFSQHIYKLTLLEQTYLSNEFIYYLLKSPFVREQIISATNGSTVNMLAIDGLQRPEFRLPPKEKVLEFSEIVGGYWERKDLNYNQICILEKLRDTLLPKFMSGDVRVKMEKIV